MSPDFYVIIADGYNAQGIIMAGKKEQKGCLEDEVTYPHGWEYCLDAYCFKCIDGKWEINPSIGVSTDLSKIL